MSLSLDARPAAQDPAARRRSTFRPALAASAAGLGFLLARPGLDGLPAGWRTGVLAAGYLAMVAAGTVSGARDAAAGRGLFAFAPGRALFGVAAGSALFALAAGLAAVLAVALLAGPASPLGGVGTPFAALGLSLLAAVGEEALFRGALYGALRRWGAPVAVAGSALLFALVHIPSYGPAALPVDLGAGLLFGWQRWVSGRWTVPAATHAAANLLAVILR
jgi:membrane protease YdiL (CAAX protease family)